MPRDIHRFGRSPQTWGDDKLSIKSTQIAHPACGCFVFPWREFSKYLCRVPHVPCAQVSLRPMSASDHGVSGLSKISAAMVSVRGSGALVLGGSELTENMLSELRPPSLSHAIVYILSIRSDSRHSV